MTKRDEITALVGEEATMLAYRGVRWYRIGVLGIFPVGFGFILVAVLLRQPYFLFGIGLSLGWWGACFVPGARMDGRAGKAASAYLSQREGVSIAVKSGGIRLWVWRKEIERAHHRLAVAARQRDTQTASALRNQEWLDQKQRTWEEYRLKHPQDPGHDD